MTQSAYIIDILRTPIGKYGGALASIRPDDLAAHVIRKLLERNAFIDLQLIEDVIFGAANQAGEDNRNVARMALLLAGVPVEVGGATVNRLCASGLQAIMDAARALIAGEGSVYIAGGVEPPSGVSSPRRLTADHTACAVRHWTLYSPSESANRSAANDLSRDLFIRSLPISGGSRGGCLCH